MAFGAQSLSIYISTLEKDNASLRARIKDLEGICQSLAQHIENEDGAYRWLDSEVSDEESYSDATTVGKPDWDETDFGLPRDVRREVSDKESVASNSESESESESELESTTVEESK